MYNIAIVGAGGMGGLHTRNLRKLSNVRITGVCDPNIEAANALAESAPAYTNFGALLKEQTPDAAFICVPPFAHGGEVALAAEAGIHVFIEKPIGISTAAAQSMVEAANRSGIKTQVGYHFRFGGAVRELMRRIESGEAGRPVLFTGCYACNHLHAPWWRDRDKSGSQILEQVIHTYDLSMHLMGKPAQVSGLMDNLCHRDVPGYTIEDVSCANIRFASGALGSITATNCAVPGVWRNQFEAVFERLTVLFDDANHALFIDTAAEKPISERVDTQVDMMREEVDAFIALLDGGKPVGCTIPEGFESLKLVEAVATSAGQDGKLISIV